MSFDKFLEDEDKEANQSYTFPRRLQTINKKSSNKAKHFLINRQYDIEYKYFYITNNKCRSIFLRNERTYSKHSKHIMLLLFNSAIYNQLDKLTNINHTNSNHICFYYDLPNQAFYLTVRLFIYLKI
jgi:hypothetical protein